MIGLEDEILIDETAQTYDKRSQKHAMFQVTVALP